MTPIIHFLTLFTKGTALLDKSLWANRAALIATLTPCLTALGAVAHYYDLLPSIDAVDWSEVATAIATVALLFSGGVHVATHEEVGFVRPFRGAGIDADPWPRLSAGPELAPDSSPADPPLDPAHGVRDSNPQHIPTPAPQEPTTIGNYRRIMGD